MSWSGHATHFRVMRTINPAQGEMPWAVTKVNELMRNDKLAFGKLEFVQEGIHTETQARTIRMKHMVNNGVFSQ